MFGGFCDKYGPGQTRMPRGEDPICASSIYTGERIVVCQEVDLNNNLMNRKREDGKIKLNSLLKMVM